MALDIVYWPDPVLTRPASPVGSVDEELRSVVAAMRRVMFRLKGVGLAAPQVGVGRRVMLVCPSGAPGDEEVVVDPEILERHGEVEGDEGCLSLPGLYGPVVRAERIRVRALDRDGQVFEREVDGLLAVCIQHEIDHLDGKLFVDYLSNLKRQRIRKKLEKEARQGGERAQSQRAI